ncbi:MAG: hypothetical protein WHV28_00480 [Bacteroidota bacterium]
MRGKPYILLILMLLASCELIVIKAPPNERQQRVELSQRAPLSVVMLFKAELDSSNVFGAMSLIASPEKTKYLAEQRYERITDIQRVRRILQNKKVTEYKANSVAEDISIVSLELNWLEKINFVAAKIDSQWYVTDYKYPAE